MKERSAYKNNASGLKGVYWYEKLNKWVARATVNNKKIHLGYFSDKEQAKSAFDVFYEKNKNNRNCTQETHGKYKTRTYIAWRSMLNRCNLPSQDSYVLYGGKGITYDEKWSFFERFYNDMGDCPPKMTLDRIDPSQGYTKENCRWADAKTQANNKTNNRLITAFNHTLTLSQWSEISGIKRTTISARIEIIGLSPEESLKFGRLKKPETYTGIEEKLGIIHSKERLAA